MAGRRIARGASAEAVVRLCGALFVLLDGDSVADALPGPQGRLLFAFLILNRARSVRREELIEALWPRSAPDHPRAALRTLLSRLRRVLPASLLVGTENVRLALPERSWIDVDEACRATERATAAEATGNWRDAHEQARTALELTAEAVMPGLEAPWLERWRREIDERRREALAIQTRAAVSLGSEAEAVRLARALVAADPYRESAYVLLMEALAAQGNVAEAIGVYERLRRRLVDDLGIAPGTDAQQLHQRLVTGATSTPRLDLPLPSEVAVAAEQTFVGREHEVERLVDRLARLDAADPRLLLITGDAGVGKSRLCAELAQRAHRDGSIVLYGRCSEEPLLPFEPFVQGLRDYVRGVPADLLTDRLGPLAPDLARVLPELRRRLVDLPDPDGAEPETRRYRLFEAVASALSQVGGERPAVMVVDDLHWADRSTMLMLAHLARALRPARTVLLSTYRAGEASDEGRLADLIADLRARELAETVPLAGLDPNEVAVLIEARAGRPSSAEFSVAMHGFTEGNPFFVQEVLRTLLSRQATGEDFLASGLAVSELGVPEGVKEVIGRRIDRLGEPTRRVLTVGSVVGRRFSLDVVEPLVELEGDELLDAIDRALAARVIEEVPEEDETFAFSHPLIRETLYEGLTRVRRQRLHYRVAKGIEGLPGPPSGARVAALAHHHLEAGSRGDRDAAVAYARRAGATADAAVAYEEAIRHYADALAIIDATGAEPRTRWELLVALGESCMKAGENERGRAAFAEAAAVARERGDAAGLAIAALGFGSDQGGGIGLEWGVFDERLVELLEEALAGLPAADSPLRARLMARLSVALYFGGDRDRKEALSAEAIEMAARTGEDAALTTALASRHGALWGADDLAERLEASDRIVELAGRLGDRELELQGRYLRVLDLAEAGPIDRVDRELERFFPLADEVRQPSFLWYAALLRAMRALLAGGLEEGERRVVAAAEIGQRMGDQNAAQGAGVQLLYLRREQGRLAELEPALREFAARYPSVPGWWALVAFIDAELGRLAGAREAFARLTETSFAALPRDANWLPSMAYAAEACALLDDRDSAVLLHDLLSPYADRNVIVGPAIVCHGSLSRYLGLVAAAAGSPEAADRHFERAIRANADLRAPALVARTHYDRARALSRHRPAARDRALALAGEALAAARGLGMDRLVEEVEALIAGGGR